MQIAVVGGKLQGVEILYLARKAGHKTVLIDKNPNAIATQLCDHFLQFQFSLKHPIPEQCPPIDIILPAIEDDEVLKAVEIWAESTNIPLAFDPQAYRVSKSKLVSDKLFNKLNLPAPNRWPACGFPVVVKPDQDSGSRGVTICHDQKSLNRRILENTEATNLVIQEYVQGPSYSIEVIGRPGSYHPLQITELHMDRVYDCKRVTAPTELTYAQRVAFEDMACSIANELALSGIMDLEVVLHNNSMKLLEIDARFPSQTPIAVFWSTGNNMVDMLCELFLHYTISDSPMNQPRYISLEHIRVLGDTLEVCGEHIMSSDTSLTLQQNFFGAAEALTSYLPGKRNWVATMIFAGSSHDEVREIRKNCYHAITNRYFSHLIPEEEH